MKTSFKIAQVSDSHLFAQKNSEHCGANVYLHLYDVLEHINSVTKPDLIVFTGDLTQDHTDESYINFAQLFAEKKIDIPVYYLAGNHDEFQHLDQHLSGFPFSSAKSIELNNWQIILVQSKSERPSGIVSENELIKMDEAINPALNQLLMMHHHPVDVGYFIDKHGLKNKDEFWSLINKHASISAIACGHIHQALTLTPEQTGYSKPVYTCPATSIQFDTQCQTSACNGQGAGYRIFELSDDGQLNTQPIFLLNEPRNISID